MGRSLLFILNVYIWTLLLSQTQSAANTDDDFDWYKKKISSNEAAAFPQGKVHVLRLGPGEDFVDSLWRYARVTNLRAASIVSVVGSLTNANIRYANQENGTSRVGHFEIVSVVGNIDYQKEGCEEGCGHVHISISDENGDTIGGHALSGNIIYTTAEITLLEIFAAEFYRELDEVPGGSGYYELKVKRDSRYNDYIF